ncbi:MAG: NTPase [Endomicrobia bacterium]|nr:NTPase [Endomicrobiia bacterium]
MTKNLFITGLPGVGKTSLVIKIANENAQKIGGFYTQEIRQEGIRKGFKICTTYGQQEIFAWKNLKSDYMVGSYGVNLSVLETIGIFSLLEALKNKQIILIDEIGKMELLSEKFKKVLIECLNSPKKVLATIKFTPDEFINTIKNRADVKVLKLTRDNFEVIKKEVQSWINN